METKDLVTLVGIGITFFVSCANFAYTYKTNKRSSFVNTVTASRLRWIDSLRDKISEFIAVTAHLADPKLGIDDKTREALLLQRDSLLHQAALHLNPNDDEDQRISELLDLVREHTFRETNLDQLSTELIVLRNATGAYLKKEWTRVKMESVHGKASF